MEWLIETGCGELLLTTLISMVPVVELRGAIPFGVALGLPAWQAYVAAVVGNLFPVPFIIVYIRRLFHWMRKHMSRLNKLVDALERKAQKKGNTVAKYKYWGLALLVAIPLPGTGAWTGALVAAILDLPLRRAMPAIFAGVLIAGIAVCALTVGVSNLF